MVGHKIRRRKTRGVNVEFKDFQLKPFLLEAISKLNFKEPTDIQKQIIPIIRTGKSVIGQSQTGTGKSHSFLLPLIDAIDPAKNEVQVVITSPSRELAEQLYQTATQLISNAPEEIRIVSYVGGTDKKRQMSKLINNQPHIVIGTPGRILDLVNEQALKIHTASKMVIDEADMTLDLGFLHDVDQIAGRLPEKLQMLVFSATIPEKLKGFLKKYVENPVIVQLKPEHIIAPAIDNLLLSTKGRAKID
ncbi:MAG: DEAD/DEAH box helicase, partial [Trichococcus flocculiformis]